MRSAAAGLIILGLAFPALIRAQDAPRPATLGIVAGAGFGTHFLPHASLLLRHGTGDYLLRGSLGYGADLGTGGPWGGPREVAEVSVLYGVPKRWRNVLTRAALGFGYVDGPQLDPVGPGEEPMTRAVGVAFQGTVAWVPRPRLGIGLTGLANLNGFRSFGAVGLALHLGGVG